MHQRQEIREAVIAMLTKVVGGKYPTAAGSRVFAMRMNKLAETQLPAIIVYTLSEDAAQFNEAPRELKRTCKLAIEAAIIADSKAEDLLDQLAEQIEAVMAADVTLKKKAAASILTATESEIFSDGKQDIGAVRLDYEVEYYTVQGESQRADQLPIGDFAKAGVEWDTDQSIPDQIEAEDLNAIPQ